MLLNKAETRDNGHLFIQRRRKIIYQHQYGGVLALAGKKTVILEFDIRKPKVLSGLKWKTPGYHQFSDGKGTLDELITPFLIMKTFM